MKHLIDILDLSLTEIDELIELALKIIKNPEKFAKSCEGKILATLFFEPSTRTKFSFESAMYKLGGQVIGFADSNSSSASKGESLADTSKVVGLYSDIIALRHDKEGAPLVASKLAGVPVINAGDGGHNHPTQTLADLLTIKREKTSFDNLHIGVCGDLMFGRTVHSLINAITRYKNVEITAISPSELCLPDYIIDELKKNNIKFNQTESLENSISSLDVLYMTRVQKERFFNEADYIRLKDSYILTKEKLVGAKRDLAIMHPLPRVNEIDVEIDSDPRACYFKQVENGMYIRMALILKLLKVGRQWILI